jgi:hypothetical protein
MNLKEIAKSLAGVGLPILGTALGGPAGAAVAALFSNWLSGPTDTPISPEKIVESILGNPEALKQAREFEAKHALTIMQMHISALEKSDAGQVELIKGDQQKSLYDRGWRPGAAWLCVLGMGYTFCLRPLLPWVLTVAGVDGVPALPAIDTTELFVMLGGLLGLGTMRHIERVKGKA